MAIPSAMGGKTLVVDTIAFPRGELFMNNIVRATRKHPHDRAHHDEDAITSRSPRDHDPQIFVNALRLHAQFQGASNLPFGTTGLVQHPRRRWRRRLSSPPDE